MLASRSRVMHSRAGLHQAFVVACSSTVNSLVTQEQPEPAIGLFINTRTVQIYLSLIATPAERSSEADPRRRRQKRPSRWGASCEDGVQR